MTSIYLVWKILKMAAATSCNATPPAQHWSSYIWFGKFKRWPPLPLAKPRHLHNNAQLIFSLENLKDGRFYFLDCHATCPAMLS
jgi:hypothetical protein